MVIASNFNLLLPVQGKADVLAYNLLAGSAALLAAPVAQKLAQGTSSCNGPYQALRNCHELATAGNSSASSDCLNLDAETTGTLVRLGMAVDSSSAERLHTKSMLHEYFHPRTLKITLCYTAQCQLSCTYCYQSGRDQQAFHNKQDIDNTLRWVATYLQKNQELEDIHLGLFGGEPLCDTNLAEDYIGRFKTLATKRNLGFSMSLTTNGVNLNPLLISRWVEQGLKYIRITLDGPPDVHNQRRPMVSGAGTFKRILNNLRWLSRMEGFGLGIAVNIDRQNVRSLASLLEILEHAGLRDEVEIVLEPVMPKSEMSASDHINRDDCPELDHSMSAKLLLQALEQVVNCNFNTPVYPGLCKPCNFVQSHSFIVDWNSSLFRCSFSMAMPDMSVGSTISGVSENNETLLSSRRVTSYCLKIQCPYLPVCAGGCRYWSWCLNKDWAAVCCPKEIWDSVLPVSISHAFNMRPVRKTESHRL